MWPLSRGRVNSDVGRYVLNSMLLIVGRISLVSLWLVALTVSYPVTVQNTGPTQTQAVDIAEQFVAKYGYCDETRPNAIGSRAVIARPMIVNGRSFWSVQFL